MAARTAPFLSIDKCSSEERERQTVVSDLDGTLLRGRSSFPYFMLIAMEACGIVRAEVLLFLAPIAWLLYHFISEASGIKFLIFVTFSGVKESSIKAVARAVLPKFYLEDLHPESWRVFSSCGRKLILTANPRIMIEPLGLEYLGADQVIGTEIEVMSNGRCSGFVKEPGVLVDANKRNALEHVMGGQIPDLGLGDRTTDFPFMFFCREGYVVPSKQKVTAFPQEKLSSPLIFHDGRMVHLPTPTTTLLTLLWAPVGLFLALLRITAAALLPMSVVLHVFKALGVKVVIKGNPPSSNGVMLICLHRTPLDPFFVSVALKRPITTITHSISWLVEFSYPTCTMRLTHNRKEDALNIQKVLERGDLVVFPEGATGREPFLCRFNALCVELSDKLVPVAIDCRMGMFYGSTVRGWKLLDPIFFFMNPRPVYQLTFLPQLPKELTCATGNRAPQEVANYIQRIIATTLGFECTTFTSKDRYNLLA